MQTEEHPAYILYTPDEITAPIIFENPHSAPNFKDFFEPACDPIHIERQTDHYVDEITDLLAAQNYSVIQSVIPRCYIDFNRSTGSVHPDHVHEGKLSKLTPNPNALYAEKGLGLVHTYAYLESPRIRICNELPTEDEIIRRIDSYWTPYHDKIKEMQEQLHETFDETLIIGCHSFPLAHMAEQDQMKGATFFIGTRDDTTCDPEIKKAVIASFERQGFNVADNIVLKGAELVRQHGTPEDGRHALQIEIAREAYMDNDTLEKREADFTKIKDAFRIMADDVSAFMKGRNHRQTAPSSSFPLPDPARPSPPSDPAPSP